MKKLTIILLFGNCAYATNNNELLTAAGNYCHVIESNILSRVMDSTLVAQINDCLQGRTYYMNQHKWANTLCELNNCSKEENPSLEKDGGKYTLQYFKNTDDISDAVADIDDKIKEVNYKFEQDRLKESYKAGQKVKLKKEKQARIKKCNSDYINSPLYKNYESTKNKFLNTRYRSCIDNGYDGTSCYAFKLRDQIGYGLEHTPPPNNCE